MTASTRPCVTFATPPRVDAAFTAWNTVVSYDDYVAAQHAVDRLSDDGFPVEHLDIIGSDLRLVERVTGRLTKTRAAAAGAASGAWFGLLIGLLVGMFTTGSWLALLVIGGVLGAAWGAMFGFLGLAATRYEIVARDGYVDAIRSRLQQAGLLSAAA